MQKYLTQLLADLRAATANPPEAYPYEMDHPVEEGQEWIPELALTPYRAISAWTGIPREAFPPEERLSDTQIEALVLAMEALWERYCFSFDLAEELAEKEAALRYHLMVDHWEEEVQYLPQSGFELELCAGEPGECRMGWHCFCLYDPPDLEEFEELSRPMEDEDIDELPF